MGKVRRILAAVIGLVAGGLFTFNGATELLNSRQLAARGQSTTGRVVESHEWVSSRLRRHTYYVTVEYQPEGGSQLRESVRVSEDTYNSAQANTTVKVFYLTKNPDVCAAGEHVEIFYGNLLWGIGILGVGAFLVYSTFGSSSPESAANRIADRFKVLAQKKYEYVDADASKYTHLDLAFYNQSRQHLEARGYIFLADQENISLRKNNELGSILRFLVSRDQTTVAILYHFKRSDLPGRESRVLDLETWFANGHFVCTSNAASAGRFNYPPEADHFFLPAETPLDAVLQAHENRVATFLSQHAGVGAVRLSSMPDVRRMSDELQRIKSEFRQREGLSKDELERLARRQGPEIDVLHAAVAERQARERQVPTLKTQ